MNVSAVISFLISLALAHPVALAALVAPADLAATNIKYRAAPNTPLVGAFIQERLRLDLGYHGHYTPERQLEQDAIAQERLEGYSPSKHPRLIFSAGSMGAGKTYSLDRLAQLGFFDAANFVNLDPDPIKEKIPDFNLLHLLAPEQAATLVHLESTYIQEIIRERALQLGLNIIMDGSFKDAAYHKDLIDRIRKTYPQYQLEIVQVIASRDIAYERVRARASTTRRHVPESVFEASIEQPRRSVEELGRYVDRVLTLTNDDAPTLTRIQERGFAPRDLSLALGKKDEKAVDLSAVLHELPPESDEGMFDVDFDLDWTLVAPSDKAKAIEIEGTRYYISPGTEEAFTAMAQEPRLRISLFSGGESSRNVKVAKAIRLLDGSGRTLFDIAYRIYSRQDLTPVRQQAPGLRFSECNKKDTSKINPDPRRVVHVDDVKHFVMPGQAVLFLGDTYEVFESYEEAAMARERALSTGATTKYIPSNETDWFNERYKIPGVFAIIMDALKAAKADPAVSFSGTASRLAELDRGIYVHRGLEALNLPASRRSPATTTSSPECERSLLEAKQR